MKEIAELINHIAERSGLPSCPEGQAVVILYARKLGQTTTRDIIFFEDSSINQPGFEDWVRNEFYRKAPPDSEFTSKTFSRDDYQKYREIKSRRLLGQMVEMVPEIIRDKTEHHGESSGLYDGGVYRYPFPDDHVTLDYRNDVVSTRGT